ncbi:hypothetical protein N7495_008951 [Penicillium taxi]|uniref:uncharacterized protein n=1 Tax=Penicillium taxi TaxID=168475 RepID=UPI002545BBEA|nr:uncharacterized protein N7495_008951 [Penicillium taxi]KAJ5888910.1 hypothetical protein N7495_008951 [Penicillium taxi]
MPDSDDEALFAELENEDDTSYRTQRIQQLNAELSSQKTNRDANPRGATLVSRDSTYPTLDNDQSVLDFTTQTSRCIVHFAHQDFARCAVMDSKLEEFAGRHYEVRFARVDVRNTPFLVEKLGIRVLPCVIGFKDGVGVEKVVGFEGLGSDGAGGFSLKVLEKRLLLKDVLSQAKFSEGDEDDIRGESDSENEGRRIGKTRKAIRSGNTGLRGRDDDDEWD